jgi:hypothetical protein
MHAPTIQEVMEPFIGYPKVIQQAILRVETHPSFSVLTKAGKRVLKQLLTRASKENGAEPVRARLDRVADASGVHYRTVQRVMTTLGTLGWVTRITDGRGQFGMFASNQFRLSPELCKLICLPHEDLKEENNTNAAQMSDGTYIDFIDLTFKKDQLEISKQKLKSKPITLPDELLEITKVGLKPSGICKLRGHAHDRGYKLEHIWQVARERILEIKATGNRVYRYLLAMICKDADYAQRAEQCKRMHADAFSHVQARTKAQKETAEKLEKSIALADKKVQEQVKDLPKGRAGNIAAMREILNRAKTTDTIGVISH